MFSTISSIFKKLLKSNHKLFLLAYKIFVILFPLKSNFGNIEFKNCGKRTNARLG